MTRRSSTAAACLAGLAAALLATAAPSGAATATPPGAVLGRWINPHGSVAVETRMCGTALCGRVVWASPEALKDAADAGVSPLVGTELLRDYAPSGTGRWQGHVYVPDMGRSFQSTLAAQDRATLRISGCILGGLICKSQLWHRV